MEDVVEALTKPLTPEEKSPKQLTGKTPRVAFKGTLQEVNQFFYRKGWVDGLPIIPPSEEAVAETAWFPWGQEIVPAAVRGRFNGINNFVTMLAGSLALGLGLAARWVDESQLDNTGNPDFRTPSWFNLDGRLILSLARWVKKGEPKIRVQATNLLDDDRIWPSGYSYLYFVRGPGASEVLEGTSYYYPLATRSVYVTLDLTF